MTMMMNCVRCRGQQQTDEGVIQVDGGQMGRWEL